MELDLPVPLLVLMLLSSAAMYADVDAEELFLNEARL